MNRITVECDGLTAFLAPGPRKANISYRSSEDGTVTFTGTASYAETVALLRAGWPAGAEQARALSAQLSAETADSMDTVSCSRMSEQLSSVFSIPA